MFASTMAACSFLTDFGDYRDLLQQLFTSNSERAKDLRAGRGPYCLRIYGQVYHFAGPLHPAPGQRPAYGQIYILDSEQAAEERLNNLRNANCDRQVMTDLGSLFSRMNPFAGAYKMMAEVEREEEEKAAREGRSAVRMKMISDTS
ncbi:hypothetical protein D918_08358 [Trichuris suis]|nr:hypothetical protein D918_08358 [Trichuris suis]